MSSTANPADVPVLMGTVHPPPKRRQPYRHPKGYRVSPPAYQRVHAWAETVLGADAGRAFSALFVPTSRSRIDKMLRRRVLDALLPKDRPVRLDLPDITGPDTQDQATAIVYAAARDGTITLAEAEAWLRIIEARYESWLRQRTSVPVRAPLGRSGRCD